MTQGNKRKTPGERARGFRKRTGKNNERITASQPYKYKKSNEKAPRIEKFPAFFCIFAKKLNSYNMSILAIFDTGVNIDQKLPKWVNAAKRIAEKKEKMEKEEKEKKSLINKKKEKPVDNIKVKKTRKKKTEKEQRE